MEKKFKVEKIRGLMAEHKESQKDLSEVLRISPNSVYNKLNGHSQFTVSEISIIAEHYKTEISYFFN